jgi:uncharacterized protein (DUF433 family)
MSAATFSPSATMESVFVAGMVLTVASRAATEVSSKAPADLLLVSADVRSRRDVARHPDVLGGEPVFAGTRIPVRHIGLLVRKGVPISEILEDYPALQESDVLFAATFGGLLASSGGPPEPLTLVRKA